MCKLCHDGCLSEVKPAAAKFSSWITELRRIMQKHRISSGLMLFMNGDASFWNTNIATQNYLWPIAGHDKEMKYTKISNGFITKYYLHSHDIDRFMNIQLLRYKIITQFEDRENNKYFGFFFCLITEENLELLKNFKFYHKLLLRTISSNFQISLIWILAIIFIGSS